MKKLNQFTTFDVDRFFKGKELMAMNSEDLEDFNSGKIIGAKYIIVIWADNTDYGKEGVSNKGQQFDVKILDAKPKDIPNPVRVQLVEPSARIYGDYRNELTVTAKDVVFVQPQRKA
ncbi:hypothetical protein [Sporolactobacillus putidus]|uniref:Uncharacterized protein n=1 Tax=Sporolactobacillus putidus TaxID=492735 RepID=A0A917S8Y9_9BACL|nr:hypothetical protein [Sporolactobacillus putidus]GGL63027.1 hypothetical protein GCM10007968_28710 [Sporolactobacillus putidus]